MMRNFLKLLPLNLPVLFPVSSLKFNSLSKIKNNSDNSRLEHRHFLTPHALFSLDPSSVSDKHETESQLITSIIENLEHCGFTKEDIVKLFESQPRLINSSINSWRELVESLYMLSFGKEDVMLMLEVWPDILTYNKNLLEKNFTAWANTGIRQELLVALLKTHPMLLSLDNQLISKRVKQYQLYFESKNRVGKLLISAPNVLEDKWKSVCDKLNYLDELCTDKSDIVSTGVLRHSLFLIKARHEFLVRAGLYKMPKKDFNKKLSKNPSLDAIVNTTDENFVSKVARLSMFEYEVFLDMFQHEIIELDNDDDKYSDDETAHNKNYNLHYKKKFKK